MKQQLLALAASLVFFVLGAVFLLLVRGLPYISEFVALLSGDIFEAAAAVVLVLAIVVGFQQAVYWFVIRRMGAARA